MRSATLLLMATLLLSAPTALAGDTEVRVQYFDANERCESYGYGERWRENGTENGTSRHGGYGYWSSSCERDMPDARARVRQDDRTLASAEWSRHWRSSEGNSYGYTYTCEDGNEDGCWSPRNASGHDLWWSSTHRSEGARVHTFLTGDASWMLTRCDSHGSRHDAYSWGDEESYYHSHRSGYTDCRHGEARVEALGFYDEGVLVCRQSGGEYWGRYTYSYRDCFLGREEGARVNGTGTAADGTHARARAGYAQGDGSSCGLDESREWQCWSGEYERVLVETDVVTPQHGRYHGRHAYEMK